MSLYAHLVWAVGVAIALILGVVFERHEGAKSCLLRDSQAANKQTVQNAVKHEAAQGAVHDEVLQYIASVSAPLMVLPAVRVCAATKSSHPGAVLQAGTPGSAVAGPAANVPKADQRAAVAVDIGQPLEKIGQKADAQVAGLVAYIQNVCLK